MRKRVLSILLALGLCMGLTVPAFAAELKIVEVPIPTVKEYEGTDYSTSNFREGLAQLWLYDENGMGTTTGYVDKTGKVVISPEYHNNRAFSEGLAVVMKDDKWGYIDTTGKEVIPLRYPWAENSSSKACPLGAFHEGLATVLKDGKYGYIDKTGKEVVPITYDRVRNFSQGLAAVSVFGKGWGYIDKTGKEVIPFQYGDAYSFSEGLAAVQQNGKWGCVDQTGKVVVDFQYDEVGAFSGGLAPVMKSGKGGYIDKAGKLVIPLQYDEVDEFSEGFAAVQQNGKWGYIDKTGKLVVPCKYGEAISFSEGFAAVRADDELNAWGFIDKTGKEVVQPIRYTGDGGKYYTLRDGSFGKPSFSDGYVKMWRAYDGASHPTRETVFYFAITVDAEVSSWAREHVDSAAAKGLMPDGLGNDFREKITRAEFAALAVKLYEAMSGQEAPAPGKSPFPDTDDAAVIQAEGLGIVGGMPDGTFAPDALVTREQAAIMLARVFTKLGGQVAKVEATGFADDGRVSAYAKDAVAFMFEKNIIGGVGNNTFDPQGNATVEQALKIAVEMLNNLEVK